MYIYTQIILFIPRITVNNGYSRWGEAPLIRKHPAEKHVQLRINSLTIKFQDLILTRPFIGFHWVRIAVLLQL